MKPDWYQVIPGHRWPYRVTRPVHFVLPSPGARLLVTRPVHAEPLAKFEKSGWLMIFPGYAWDGATWAPDFPQLMRAVVLHDLLCQCCEHPAWPIRREEADREFYREARQASPVLAAIYFAGILAGGRIHRWAHPPGPAESITIQKLS